MVEKTFPKTQKYIPSPSTLHPTGGKKGKAFNDCITNGNYRKKREGTGKEWTSEEEGGETRG